MKSFRFFLRFTSVFLSRHRKIILLGFLMGISAFLLLPRLLKFLPQEKETKLIGLVGRYTVESLPEEIQEQISLGLTQIDKSGVPLPGLAKEWSVENDGKNYTFRLKDDLFWHDGTPVKASDINYNFKDAQITIIDDKTIRFVLKEPFAPFPTIVARPVFKKGLIGAGFYRINKITRSGQFIESVYLESDKKENPNLKYRFYPTETVAKTGLKLGEVRTLKNIIDMGGFENWKDIQITPQTRFDQYVAIFFNTSKSPFDGKGFRQALAYAIPKPEKEERALGPISPLSWVYNPDIKSYDYNLEKAKEFLKKAVDKDQSITIKLSTASYLLPEAEKIAKAWETLGLKVTVEPLSATGEEVEALLAIQEIPADPDQYVFWHSTQQESNITKFNKPRIDKLLEDGRTTQDREKRKKIYYDFQRFLAEEIPAIFLYYPTTYEISRK